MNACKFPDRTGFNNAWAIHAEPLHRCPANRRAACDDLSILRPFKMFRPVLYTWIEAGKTEVLKIIATIGENMLNMHRLPDDALRRQAVFTAIVSALMNPPDGFRPGEVIHPSTGLRSSRLTV